MTTLSRLQAARSIARIGELLQLMADREASLEAKVARAKRRYDNAKAEESAFRARSEQRLERLAIPLYHYFTANRGERKSLDVDTGRLAIVEGRLGKTEKLASDEAIAAEILALDPAAYSQVVTVTTKINLTLLKQHEGLLGQLTTVHVPVVDTLTVDPDNTSKKFRRAISWFTRMDDQSQSAA